MRGVLRIFRKELFEFLDGPRGMVMVVVLPCLLLLVVGQLSARHRPVRLLVAGTGAVADGKNQEIDFEALLQGWLAFLDEPAGVTYSVRETAVVDPLAELQRGEFDLVFNIESPSPDGWLFYSAETSHTRFMSQRALVAGLERALLAQMALMDQKDVVREMKAGAGLAGMSLGAPHRLVSYYPHVSDLGTALFTRVLALILCMLPFVLMAPSWIREMEAHTLESLVAAPGLGPGVLVSGKILFAVALAMVDLLLMLILAESFQSLGAKPGLSPVMVFLIPALLASALLGLAVSAIARSQLQVAAAVALYLLASTLFGGFFHPIEAAGPLVSVLSKLFPLTYVHPMMTRWLYGGGPGSLLSTETAILWSQALAAGVAAAACVRWAMRRL